MAHAHKPDFVFRRSGRVHLNRPVGASVQSTTGSRCVRISGSNAGYTMFRGSVKGTVYPLHSPVSPSLSLPASPCAITFQLDSTAGYSMFRGSVKSTGYLLHFASFHFTSPPVRAITFQLDSTNCEDGGIWDDVEKDGKSEEYDLRRRCISET